MTNSTNVNGGSSLHTWDLTHRLSSYTSGLKTIDDDLSYLYGQLPGKIRGAATAVMEKAERKVQTDVFVAGINVLGTALGIGGSLLNDLTDTDITTPTLATSLNNAGNFFQSAAFVWGRLYGLDKDTSPSCGVKDFVKTWDEYYEAANLMETYKFLSSSSSLNSYLGPADRTGRTSNPTNTSETRYRRSPIWTPLQDNWIPPALNNLEEAYSVSISSQERSYSSSQTSMLDLLTVETLPPVMEFRVCEFTTKLKSSLSCLFDSSLAESRVLDECITNIMEVSSVRLDVTQKVIDIKRELEELESKEDHHAF